MIFRTFFTLALILLQSPATAEFSPRQLLAIEISQLAMDVPHQIRNNLIPPGPARQAMLNQIRMIGLNDCDLHIQRRLPNGIPISEIVMDLRFATIGPDDTELPYIFEPSSGRLAAMGAIAIALPEEQRTTYRVRSITREDRLETANQHERPLTDWTFEESEAQTARILVVHGPTPQRMADLAEALKQYQQNYCRFTS